ncbi:MAG: 2-C-methyl-D-erythritol 4-phosphate cytidylyltransferase [Oscillospiraceae bacterium]|jgi:2-C-methyl-D-erythritol 4-phosphate cytidylyltransferase|nr:2-C-methyl-D-erythritol 4-phosphate cytidylyltransferase [Oscillospiraceae bacterium]
MKRQKQARRPYCAAVVPAAGQGRRMGEGTDKLFRDVAGAPLLVHTLRALEACPDIDEVVVAARPDAFETIGALVRRFGLSKVRSIVRGGGSRPHSVLNGLLAVSPFASLAAVHDGARPLVTPALISETVKLAAKTGAAAPAVPPKDTLKEARLSQVLSTPDRAAMMLVQTPQVFDLGLIKGALTRALREGWQITDDCAALERMGMSVFLSQGSYENIKVTTPEDLIICEALLARRARASEGGGAL